MQQMQTVIHGHAIPYTMASIPIGKCRLDPKNPRIQYVIAQRNPTTLITEAELEQLLWKKDSVKALAQAIMQNGGVRDHVIVLTLDDGDFLILEGNCRATCLRHLSKEYPNDFRFSHLPAMIFKSLTDEQLAIFLAQIHISGKIAWDAYEKAKSVFDLHTKYGKPYEWLAMDLRMSKSQIKHLLESYQMMEEFLNKYPTESIRKFSRFAEALKKKVLRERLEKDPVFKDTFFEWLKTDKLTDNYHIRELPRVLVNPSALDALVKGTFDDAYSIILKSDPALESYLFSSIKSAIENLKGASLTEINELNSDPKKISMLQELYAATQDLASVSKVQLI